MDFWIYGFLDLWIFASKPHVSSFSSPHLLPFVFDSISVLNHISDHRVYQSYFIGNASSAI